MTCGEALAVSSIQACAGGVCANIAGELLRKYDLGAAGNTISGMLGGGLGAQIVGAFAGDAGTDPLSGGLHSGSIVGQILSGAVGGGVLMMIIGVPGAARPAAPRPSIVEIDRGECLSQPLALLADRPVTRCLRQRAEPDRNCAHLKGAPIGDGMPQMADALDHMSGMLSRSR